MKTSDKHILTGKWSSLAQAVEQKLFRIEAENRWLAATINGCIAGSAVALVAWLVSSAQEGDLLLFACLGSSAASVVFAPVAKSNSLRTIILAYVLASLTCVVLFPLHRMQLIPIPLQCFLAVALPISLMRLTDSMHPAAIGSALAFIIYDRDIESLLLLLLAILGLLTIVKLLAYIYLEDLEFKTFWKEFHREYHGREMTITVTDEAPDTPATKGSKTMGRE